MRIALTILIALSSYTIVFGAETSTDIRADSTVEVLVLPPYDEFAGPGNSPNTRKFIESILTGKGKLTVIPFPFRDLMDVPHQMVFDKQYCRSILKKVDCDIIIMTQIITDNGRKPGTWPWAYKIRVYNPGTGKQLNSVQGGNLKAEDVEKDIIGKVDKLIKDIELTFKVD